MTITRRAVLYDALRMCSSDGALTPSEVDCLLRSADAMGLPRQVVADLRQIVLDELALRQRRYQAITAPYLHMCRVEAMVRSGMAAGDRRRSFAGR